MRHDRLFSIPIFDRFVSDLLSKYIFGDKITMPTTTCPECDEDVYVDAESEQGDVVTCDECGSRLEVVGLDPIEVDLQVEHDADDTEEDLETLDYDSDRY